VVLSETYSGQLHAFMHEAAQYLNACKIEMIEHVVDALRQVTTSGEFVDFVCKAFQAHLGERHAEYSLNQYVEEGQLILEFENDKQVFSFTVDAILAAAKERLAHEYMNSDESGG